MTDLIFVVPGHQFFILTGHVHREMPVTLVVKYAKGQYQSDRGAAKSVFKAIG